MNNKIIYKNGVLHLGKVKNAIIPKANINIRSQGKATYKNGVFSLKRVKAGASTSSNNIIIHPEVEVQESALNGYFRKVKIKIPETQKSVNLEEYLSMYNKPVLSSLENNAGCKVIMSVCCKMSDGAQIKNYYFNSKPHVIYSFNNKNNLLNALINEIIESFNCRHFEGSGWSFLNFENVELNYGSFTPFKGGCGENTLPLWLKLKKASTHIIADNNKCFFYCITRHFIPTNTNAGRITREIKKIEKEEPNKYANFNNINYPTTAEDLDRFQRQNSHLHIVVFGVAESEERTPVIFDGCPKYHEGEEKREQINLLLYNEHYYLINDLSRLLSSQVKNRNGKLHFCYKCQRGLKSEEALDNHLKKCNDSVLLNLPEEGKNDILKFQIKKVKTPCVTVYFDFESLLLPVNDEDNKKINKHIPAAFSIVFISSDEKIYKSENITYTMKDEKENVAEVFIKTLIKRLTEILILFSFHKKDSDMIPIFAHNLSGYDSHLCILELAKEDGDLHILPSSEERYISFSNYKLINNRRREFRFLDSFRFLSSSLDGLVKGTEKTTENFKYTTEAFPDLSLDILTKKGIYPYEWMDSFEKTKSPNLPDIKSFYSTLSKKGITEEEHRHALLAWDAFKCQNMDDYQKNYCLLDTLLLADVMENFRKMNISNFKIDPFIYGYTLPGASWHNMLKFTKQEIGLITDRDIYEDFEAGIRGGVVLNPSRYCKANNKYLSDYDPSKPSNFIFYIDKNNLYGDAMSRNVPHKIERKMTEEDIKNWQSFPCALVCDLEIVKDKKDFLKDYPPCAERLTINGVEKLTLNLKDKKEYMIYSELLKFFISHNMVKIKKIYRGYIFGSSQWLESYISYNKKERAKTKDTAKQNFYKLCNNAIFGKTCENPRKRSNVELVDSETRAKKLLCSPEFLGFNILSEDLVAVSRKKTMVQANKPIFTGFYILEMSKLIMYRLIYDYLIPKFGDRLKILYSDTDSLILDIQSVDLYEEMKEDVPVCFDTSNYPENHPLYSIKNKNRLGFFKDETKGKPIKEYASTCPKSYAIRTEEDEKTKESLKLKGVVKACINARDICFNDYLRCIFEDEIKTVDYRGFTNKKHVIYTEQLQKIALNPLQDVRLVLEDKIHTVPMGYFSEEEEARRLAILEEKREEIKKKIKELTSNNI